MSGNPWCAIASRRVTQAVDALAHAADLATDRDHLSALNRCAASLSAAASELDALTTKVSAPP